MKPRFLISALALTAAAAMGSVGCSSGGQPAASDGPSASSDQSIITATGNIMAWPAGPIAWNGLVGTWPISVWSPGTIGGLAFGINGVTNLGVTCGLCGVSALPITTPWLNAFTIPTGLAAFGGTPLLGTAGLFAPAFGFTGTFAPFAAGGFGFGAFSNNAAFQTTFLNNSFSSGFNSWLTPALTSSALMFNNLAAINSFTPFTFNVTFTAQSAAQAAAFNTASLSIFATPILADGLAAGTAIPFMSIAFPILGIPFGGGVGAAGLGLGAAGLGVGTVGLGTAGVGAVGVGF